MPDPDSFRYPTQDTTISDQASGRRMSYKFQRLRERIRTAIEAGELAGKLPGERLLARQFKVNAKTLGKALSDLAAEGLLDRNIGLGTFVRGADSVRTDLRTLLLHDSDDTNQTLVDHLRAHGIDTQTHTEIDNLPPSLLNQFKSVVVASSRVNDQSLHNMVMRSKQVVLIDRQNAQYLTHAVLVHRSTCSGELARRAVRFGHRAIMIVDPHDDGELIDFVHSAVTGSGLRVLVGTLDEVLANIVDSGVTALLCNSSETARHAMSLCRSDSRAVPRDVSVMAVGRLPAQVEASGIYVRSEAIAAAVSHLLHEASSHKPVSIWLSGEYVDAGTFISPRH